MAAEVVDAARAVAEIERGDTVMVGGFGLVGAPLTLIEALVASAAARELTVISNNLGEPGKGLGALLLAGGVRKAIGSYFTSNPDVVAAHERGELEVELLPQGTLSESIRSGGAGPGRLLHADRGRHAAGRGARGARDRRRPLPLLPVAARRRGADAGAHRRRARQPRLRQDRAQLQPGHGDRRPGRGRRGRRDRRRSGDLAPELVATPHLFVDYLVRAEVTL